MWLLDKKVSNGDQNQSSSCLVTLNALHVILILNVERERRKLLLFKLCRSTLRYSATTESNEDTVITIIRMVDLFWNKIHFEDHKMWH